MADLTPKRLLSGKVAPAAGAARRACRGIRRYEVKVPVPARFAAGQARTARVASAIAILIGIREGGHMAADDRVVLITARERSEGDPTPGMVREQAVSVEGMWAGLVRTEAHMTSGWHHHGDHDTTVYVVDGGVRMEFGPDGRDAIEAGPGDFVHVPKRVIHREGNPLGQESHVVVVRAGHGPPTINVDGPGPPAPNR